MTIATETTGTATLPEDGHAEAARRFIAAIVAGDATCRLLGETQATAETQRLWDRFLERYAAVVSGPYAKHGPDALRIALSSI